MFSPIAAEVKVEILSKIKAGEKVSDIAKQYGISEKTIYTWLSKRARGTVSILEYSRLKNENRQMKEIIGVLTVELAKLKKRGEIKTLLFSRLKSLNKTFVARLLGIARTSIYRKPTNNIIVDGPLKEQVLKVLKTNPSYGHRRVALALGYSIRRR